MKLSKFLKQLHIPFKETKWYEIALTHSSYSNENIQAENYETLEFFGDSIINFLVAEFLFQQKLKNSQIMSSRKHFLISNWVLAKVAKKLQILSLIKVGRTIKKNNISDAILADCFEAFVGAIYLDFKNLGFVRQFLHQHLINANWEEASNWIDYKTLLKEFVQKQIKSPLNLYESEKINEEYHVICTFNKLTAKAIDANKKVATKKAAKMILQQLGIIS